MEISVNKIRLPWRNAKLQSLSDGSAVVIKFTESSNELVELSPYTSYYDKFDSKTFQLKINLPERSIDHIIHIIKSSANVYRALYSDCKNVTRLLSFNSYDTINAFLEQLKNK